MISCVHTHSSFCDGKNTMAQMAKAAYALGIETYGFSGHSYYPDDDFGMKAEILPEYMNTARILQKEYAGKMDILCGIEIDETIPGGYPYKQFDYVIGSSHATRGRDGRYYMVDHSPECFSESILSGFNGNAMLFIEEYYKQFARFIAKVKPDIIGHLDLVCKFNSGNRFFDEESKEYRTVAIDALDELLKNGIVFEVNTGAISRGYMQRPYPDAFLLKRILDKKGKIIITTDTHSTETIDYFAKEAEELVRAVGFKSICNITKNGFVETKI